MRKPSSYQGKLRDILFVNDDIQEIILPNYRDNDYDDNDVIISLDELQIEVIKSIEKFRTSCLENSKFKIIKFECNISAGVIMVYREESNEEY